MTVDRTTSGYRRVMGFNPFREQERSVLDIVMVVLALLATVAVILWAVLG